MFDCRHESTRRGKDVPRRWGSFRTEVCASCGAFRTHGHDPGKSHLSGWYSASEYDNAVAETELD